MAEHIAHNDRVLGSSPGRPTLLHLAVNVFQDRNSVTLGQQFCHIKDKNPVTLISDYSINVAIVQARYKSASTTA